VFCVVGLKHKAEAKELDRANPANEPTDAATTADFIKTLSFIGENYQGELEISRSECQFFGLSQWLQQ